MTRGTSVRAMPVSAGESEECRMVVTKLEVERWLVAAVHCPEQAFLRGASPSTKNN